jgi:hypothetical protein
MAPSTGGTVVPAVQQYTQMDTRPKFGIRKRRGRPQKPLGADSTISFRLDYHTEWELEYWRSIQPNPPSRSQAVRRLLRMGLAAAEKQREDTSQNSG